MRQPSLSRSRRVYGRDGDEAGVRLGMVADVAGDHGEAVHGRRPLAGDRRLGRVLPSATSWAASAVVAAAIAVAHGMRGEEPPALVERGRVRANDADLLQRDERRADEAVANRQDGLAA